MNIRQYQNMECLQCSAHPQDQASMKNTRMHVLYAVRDHTCRGMQGRQTWYDQYHHSHTTFHLEWSAESNCRALNHDLVAKRSDPNPPPPPYPLPDTSRTSLVPLPSPCPVTPLVCILYSRWQAGNPLQLPCISFVALHVKFVTPSAGTKPTSHASSAIVPKYAPVPFSMLPFWTSSGEQ